MYFARAFGRASTNAIRAKSANARLLSRAVAQPLGAQAALKGKARLNNSSSRSMLISAWHCLARGYASEAASVGRIRLVCNQL